MPAGIFKLINGLLLFSAKSCPTLSDCKDCSTPGFPVLKYLPEFAPIQVHWVGDAIQPSHYLLSPFPLAFNLSQHQCLFQWVGSSILYFNPLINPLLLLFYKSMFMQNYLYICLFLSSLIFSSFLTFHLNHFSSSSRTYLKFYFIRYLFVINSPFWLSEGDFFSLSFARYIIICQHIIS